MIMDLNADERLRFADLADQAAESYRNLSGCLRVGDNGNLVVHILKVVIALQFLSELLDFANSPTPVSKIPDCPPTASDPR